MKVKYIVGESDMGLEIISIFSDMALHGDMRPKGLLILSAGFLNTTDGICYGRSMGLDKDSRPEIDTKLAKKLLGIS